MGGEHGFCANKVRSSKGLDNLMVIINRATADGLWMQQEGADRTDPP
jgi:hypothetical protein